MTTLQDCRALDAQDPLRGLRELFTLPEGVIYLDGNSLGPLPKHAPERIARAVRQEWGEGLIRSWNTAGWFEMPQRLGDRIAPLVGARPGELVATDSTSINLFKVLSAALSIVQADAPQRRTVVSERSNFPTDLYIAESLCRERGFTLHLLEAEQLPEALDEGTAVLMLTHVNYRTGAMHDMAAVTRAAHAAGALVAWDLAHSAGAVEVDLHAAGADFAVGCGYKYLNGGPGAPAFAWVHPRHADRFWQPLAGWWGHAAPFAFHSDYRPAPGIARYLCGTQPVLSMVALDCGLDTVLAAQPLGGMAALRRKSLALTDLFIALVQERCGGHGLGLATPREHARRGSQVCLTRAEGAYAIVQALVARGVIGDFRAGRPDILRFGFTPLYLRFEDAWNAVEHLREVLESGEWQRPEFHRQQVVT
ncbi:kynureninase [Ramlibacter monticola]|uniref:Kynureninase n=1 Tax=Ramlibacter monticola TaxID=1926872 RepID=A0A936Z6F0_9BURK|nr:kynureninase [Ramlibacter monticola]MBL0394360.1 kynureninase [Ramlibacter monticola]